MNDKNNLRMLLREALDNMWSRIRSLFGGLDDRVTALEQGGGGGGGDENLIEAVSFNGVNVPPDANKRVSMNESDPTVPAWAKAATKPTYTAQEVGAIPTTQKGAASGVAELDSSGKVPSSQLPSYVDDVLEYASHSAFPSTGETGKIYVATDTNITYRWSGSAYVEISPSLALGETSSTAYRGDRGKAAYDHAQDKGSAFASGLYKIQTNAEGHVTGATAVQKSDITALGIPGQDTTYTFTDNDPTLAWGTRSKVGTTGGTDLHVTMPAKPTYTADNVGAVPNPLRLLDVDLNDPDNGITGQSNASIRAVDKNGRSIGTVQFSAYKDGSTFFSVYAANLINGVSLVYGLRIIHKKDGSCSYQVSAPASFRAAISAQEDVGFYVDAQGYLCQRIRSDT